MKTAEELAQEGRVGEAFDVMLGTDATAAAKHSPEEIAEIFETALRGMPSNMRKVIEGLSDDMKIKFVQKAMRGLKGASLDDAPTPIELAREGRSMEAFDMVLASKGQEAFEYDLVPKALKAIVKDALDKLDKLVLATRKGTWPSPKVERAVMRHKPGEMDDKQFIGELHKAYAAWSKPMRNMSK